LVKALPKLLLDSNYRPQLKTVLASVGASPSGILQNILKDASTPNRLERVVERLGLMADKIDSMREDIKEAVRKELMEMFTKKPTTVELSALTLGILDTDISSLEGYSLGQLKKLFMNEEVLKEKIKVVTTAIGRKDRKNLNWLLTQSKGLGRYMATHQSNIAQNLNAENIVKMFLTDKPLVEADKEMVQLVDELATLYAVSYTPTATRELVGKMIDKEPKAVKAIINTHRLIKEESAKRLFINNKAHIIKGYTRAIDDNMTEIAIKPLSMRKDMENEGFKLVSVLEKDPMDRSGVAMGVYKSKSFTTMPYNRAATRLTDIHKRGTSLTDVYFKANAPMAAEQAKADKKRLDKLRRQAVKDMMEGKFNVDKGNTLSPIIDQTGNVVDYRYNMAKSTKRELLNQDITAHKVLAHMLGNVQDKMETDRHNEIVLDTILDDMKKNYVEGSIIGKNGERYVTITKDSKDERIAEIYSILPENIKTAIARSDAKQIAVREDLLSMYFGFRDPSVFNSKVFKAILPQEVLAIGRVAGKIWEEVVSISKVDIVIRTPMVFIDNIKSNFMWAYATGTNVFTVAKLQLESLKEVLDYVNKSRELNQLKIAKATGNIGKKDVSKIGMLQEELNNNPAKVLIDAGMYQTIIEDIERSDLESQSVLSKKFRGVIDKVPEWVKVGADMLYISPATAPFKFMVKAIQYSDLVARLAQYKILTKQGVRPRQALDEVLDVFVNYNKPSSSTEEWANQMGLMMFTKYFKRVQRAINIGVREYPVTFLANMAMQEFVVGDIPGVEDSNVFSKNYGATTYVPTELLDHMYRAVMPTSVEIGMGDVKLF
jgi:hypothetical protein